MSHHAKGFPGLSSLLWTWLMGYLNCERGKMKLKWTILQEHALPCLGHKLLINIIGTWVFLKEEVPCFYLRSLCSSSFTEQKRWRKGTCNIWSFAETSELWQSQSKQPDVDEWLGQVMPRNSTAWMGTLPGVSLKMVMTELYADCGFLQEGLDSILEYHPNIIVILTLLGQEFMKYTIH